MEQKKNEIRCNINQLELAKNIIMAEPIDLGADILEVGLDQLLDEGIIKDIPVFGSIVKVGRTISTIHDAIFTKKVLTFAQSIHDGLGDMKKWNQHKEKLMNDPQMLTKEVEILLNYIDRHTRYIKSKILGRFYAVYYNGDIDWDDFEMLAEILDVVSVYDFDTLEELYQKKYVSQEEKYNSLALRRLNSCGLADFFNGMVVTSSNTTDAVSYLAKITELGEYFFEVGWKNTDLK